MAACPTWKGFLKVSLVTVPVRVFPATDTASSLSFNQLHSECQTRIRQKKWCPACDRQVDKSEIVKGYEFEKGRYVVFTGEELSGIMKGLTGGIVDVVQFVAQDDIDPIYYRSSYYLAPEKTGVKAYQLLLRALEDKAMVGIAKVAIREREHLATVRADEGVIILETMYWPDEIREPHFESLEEDVEIRDEEIKMAEMIIDNLTTTFDPSAWHDTSREAVEAAAQQKIDGQEIVAPDAPQPTGVVDLMDALRASIEATKQAS